MPTLEELVWANVAERLRPQVKLPWRDNPSTLAEEFSNGKWTRHDPPYDYHGLIGETIRDLVENPRPGIKGLIVNVPPQYGKSELCSHWLPVWYLDKFPNRRVIEISHEADLAVYFSREARDTILNDSAEPMPRLNVRISPKTESVSEWMTTKQGGMLARGIRGSVTGRPGDLIIMDDPIKDLVQAHSKTWREAVWGFFRSVLLPRLSLVGLVVIVMTRWHEDDIVGRLLSTEYEGDPNDWVVLKIPAIAREDDALGRPVGAPLPKPGESVEAARVRLATTKVDLGSYLFAGLYGQEPSEPEGTIFKRKWWQYYREMPTDLDYVFTSWDMAFKDTKDSSYVVGQAWGVRQAEWFLLDQVRDRMDFPTTKKEFGTFATRWPARRHLVEDKANGPAIIAELKATIAAIVPVTVKGSKEARAHAVTGKIEAGNVYLPVNAPWLGDYLGELAEFPNGANDDQVDATTQALDSKVSGKATTATAASITLPA